MARIAVNPRDAEWAEQIFTRLFGDSIRKVRDAVEIDAVYELEGWFTRDEALELTEDVVELELIGYGWYEEEDEVDERPEGYVELESVVSILEKRAEGATLAGRKALLEAAEAIAKTFG